MTELDQIAETALALITDVREIDPQQTLDMLVELALEQPEYFAKVCMALAVWVGEPTTKELEARAATARIIHQEVTAA